MQQLTASATAVAAPALMAMVVAGCATMSQDECLTADWRTVGYEDGTRGSEMISEHRRSCAGIGIVPDLDAYRGGFAEGLRVYCRPLRGYWLGRDGNIYRGVCPQGIEQPFVEAHRAGARVHAAEHDEFEWRVRVGVAQADVDVAWARRRGLEWQLDNDPALTPVQRKALRDELLELVTWEIPALEDALEAAVLGQLDAAARVEAALNNPYEP